MKQKTKRIKAFVIICDEEWFVSGAVAFGTKEAAEVRKAFLDEEFSHKHRIVSCFITYPIKGKKK